MLNCCPFGSYDNISSVPHGPWFNDKLAVNGKIVCILYTIAYNNKVINSGCYGNWIVDTMVTGSSGYYGNWIVDTTVTG